MHMGLFSKPIGIHITDQKITLVRMGKNRLIPVLDAVIQKDLPAGIVVNGLVKDPKALLPYLKELQVETKETQCMVSLPVVSSYSGVLRLPLAIEKDSLDEAILGQMPSVLPASPDELYFDRMVVKRLEDSSNFVFIVAIEKKLLDFYRKLFLRAGWEDASFELENVGLAKALPLELAQYPRHIFIHAFKDRSLLSSVYHGSVFDGVYSKDLSTTFVQSYKAFVQQTGVPPSHVILSGDHNVLAPLTSVVFKGPKPKFLTAKFVVEFKKHALHSDELIIPTGLSLSKSPTRKNSGLRLLNLLD